MCIFCTGSFARFAARFHPAAAEPPVVDNDSETRLRTDAAAPVSSPSRRPEQNDADSSSKDAGDFLNR